MENQNLPERVVPVQYGRGSRAFRQFKNPPQPHMCIQDTIKGTSEKLYINVLGWQKIANPKQYSDPIPLYGGMQVHFLFSFTFLHITQVVSRLSIYIVTCLLIKITRIVLIARR